MPAGHSLDTYFGLDKVVEVVRILAQAVSNFELGPSVAVHSWAVEEDILAAVVHIPVAFAACIRLLVASVGLLAAGTVIVRIVVDPG